MTGPVVVPNNGSGAERGKKTPPGSKQSLDSFADPVVVIMEAAARLQLWLLIPQLSIRNIYSTSDDDGPCDLHFAPAHYCTITEVIYEDDLQNSIEML